MPIASKKRNNRPRPLKLGFVSLCDSAPVVMAAELDLFSQYGVQVELHREVGWATIRDKIIYGELDAAHAPAGLVVAASCGLGSIQCECVTGLVFNLNGNAITLSEELWKRGVRDGKTLRDQILNSSQPRVFGVVHSYSSHSFLLRNWLREHRILPDRDVRLVVVPPAQVHPNLKAGHLDGYCVGEPWNSLAVLSGAGWCAATSEDLAPRHPEKVLMVRRQFAERSEAEHLALIAALLESCRFCARPENRERIIEVMAQPQFVGAPIEALRMGMGGTFNFGHGRIEKHPTFHIFSGEGVNEPSADKCEWVIRNMISSGVVEDSTLIPRERAAQWFSTDIYEKAALLAASRETDAP